MMKNIRSRYFPLIACVLLAWGITPAQAQTLVADQTTLNGAITAAATTLVLTSASASSGSSFGAPAANQCLWMDQELMRIVSMSSTTATVTRDRRGAQPHANSAQIWIAACSFFKTTDPGPALNMATGVIGGGSGNIVCSGQIQPWININNGIEWWCDLVSNKWTGTVGYPLTYNSNRLAQ